LLASKGCPGTSPILAILATIGASSAVGGLSFISFASRLKYALMSMLFTWSRTGVFSSMLGSTLPSGGV
jgi:hypothetical protein